MIDFTKILLLGIDLKRLYNLPQLEFKTEVSEKTGVLSTKHTAYYHFCKIVIYDSGLILFSGSIHKLYNSIKNQKAPNYNEKQKETYKGFNGNQFTISQILEVRTHLEVLFDCEPQQMQFQNIEFGVNTQPNFEPKLFLKGLLYHNGKNFEYRFENNFAQVEHQQYFIKIYNKSGQFGISKHTVRVELKVTKAEYLKNLNIKTFEDINQRTLENALKSLLKRFDEVVYYDYTINKKNFTKRQKETLNNYSNPRYWLYNLKPKNRDKHKKKLKGFIMNYSKNLHQKIRREINLKGVTINRLFKKPNGVTINTSSIGLNITPNTSKKSSQKKDRICPITGVDISVQKEDSFLLSNTGFKVLEKENPTYYNFLIETLLTGKANRYEKSIYSKLSKQVRNRYFNNIEKHNLKQHTLF